ncbi:MAG: D-alanine--D-alanine ligase family protein [Candidatus Cyclobacteriaceae bacterium M2_1C_046]
MPKIKLGIIYGGRSTEHEVSVRSASNVSQYLDKELFEAVHIGISKGGKWFLTNTVTEKVEDGQPLHLRLDASKPGLFIQDGTPLIIDLFFPILHGTDGEDGSIQGLLTSMELPFVGTGVLGSSICMSKLMSKQLLAAAQLPVVPFKYYSITQKDKISYNELKEYLGNPFMAKAANLGSSVGVNKVKSEDDLKSAVEEAFKYDNILLFEKYIKGRELECSVMGNDEPVASLAAEIVINPSYEFYTYKAKYLDPEAVELHVPAKLSDEQHKQVQHLSVEAYKTLHCQDFSRVDLFLDNKGEVFINEINTIPGFTDASMFPMMWDERGISFTDLVTKLIRLAQERYKSDKKQRSYQVIN